MLPRRERLDPALAAADRSALFLFLDPSDAGGRHRTLSRLSNALLKPVKFVPAGWLEPWAPYLEVEALGAIEPDYAAFRARLPGIEGSWLLVTAGNGPLRQRWEARSGQRPQPAPPALRRARPRAEKIRRRLAKLSKPRLHRLQLWVHEKIREGMVTRRSGSLLGLALFAAALLALAASVAFRIVRDTAIARITATAQATSGKPDLDALIDLAESPAAPLAQRNRAIWALGELRDRRAIPHLRKLASHGHCDHDRWVCQREVRKAVLKIRGELSFSYWLRSTWSDVSGRLRHRG